MFLCIFHGLLTLTMLVGHLTRPSPLNPMWFYLNVSSKERVKPCPFVTFDIIIIHIFPENFIEIPQVALKM